MKYAIGILDSETANKIVYVTSVDIGARTYEVEAGKNAAIFVSKKYAMGIVEGIIGHCRRAVLIDARHFFDHLKNEEGLEIKF